MIIYFWLWYEDPELKSSWYDLYFKSYNKSNILGKCRPDVPPSANHIFRLRYQTSYSVFQDLYDNQIKIPWKFQVNWTIRNKNICCRLSKIKVLRKMYFYLHLLFLPLNEILNISYLSLCEWLHWGYNKPLQRQFFH